MKSISIWKAWLIGTGIICSIYLAWNICVLMATKNAWIAPFLYVLYPIGWVAPPFAAFLVAYLAPKRKILAGSSMAVSAAVMLGLFGDLWDRFGHGGDFHGLDGYMAVLAFGLTWNALVCLPGALAGYYAALKKQRKDVQA